MVEMAIFNARKPKDMAHAFCTSSHGALHFVKILENISDGIRIIERTRMSRH